MFPIRDVNPTRTVPYVNYLFIALNVLVFFWEVGAGPDWVIPALGLVPARFLADMSGEAITIFTSMFMHGGWVHLGGNMMFLHVMGDNVEEALGHKRYFWFYVASGIAAAIAQVAFDTQGTVPMVGASGAIAGVIAGYVVLYPRAPIQIFNPVVPLWLLMGPVVVLPAWIVAGDFFIVNLFSGLSSLGSIRNGGGVAVFAHLGGFLAGFVSIGLLARGRPRRAMPAHRDWRNRPRRSGGPGPGGRGAGRPFIFPDRLH